MNDYFYYAFIYIIEAIVFYLYSYKLFSSNHKQAKEILITIAAYLLLIPIAILKMPWLNTICFILLNTLLIHIIKKIPLPTSLFYAIILTALMGISELLMINLVPHLSIRTYREINIDSTSEELLFVILNKTFYLITTQFVCNISKNTAIYNTTEKGTYYLSAISTISASIIVLLIIVCLNVSLPNLLKNFIILSTFLLLILTFLVFAMQYHYQIKVHEYADMQLQLQKEYDTEEYYKAIISNDEQQHILIHDIKNHLITLAGLNETGDKDNVDKYIQGILSNGAFKNPRRLCDHKIMNIILTRYMNICEQNKITFTVDIRSNTLTNFTDEALTTLFCNLLDNAFAAAKSAREHYDTRIDNGECDKEWEDFYASFITLDVKHSNTNQTLIVLVNSCTTDPFSRDGRLLTTKSDKRFHGYGLRSVRNIVERNNGSIEQYYKEERNEFHTIILM